jgi:glycosyltransferase involved in cell wall biosynthesis
VLFYAGWPLGYHNQEAERKARAFAAAGRDVVWVTSVGFRNPRPSSAAKAADRLVGVLRHGPRRAPAADGDDSVRAAALLVAPPRQVPAVRALNTRWIARQLRHVVPDWGDTVAWIRNVTPELVDALPRLRPRAIVFEAVDAYHLTPGVTGRWVPLFEAAERELVQRADRVLVTNASLAPRYEAWGAEVLHVPHGVDLFPWRPRTAGTAPTLGFLGVLDRRLDIDVIRHVAQQRPSWRIRLVGPVEPGFDPARLRDLSNVAVEPPVPHSEIGERLAEFDAGLLAYADLPVYRHMSPLKNLELLAAGRPVVARPTVELERFADHVYFASTPQEFLAQAERALAEDSDERARRRRAVAVQHAWEPRLAQLVSVLEDVAPSGERAGEGAPGRAEVDAAAQEPDGPGEVQHGEHRG